MNVYNVPMETLSAPDYIYKSTALFIATKEKIWLEGNMK